MSSAKVSRPRQTPLSGKLILKFGATGRIVTIDASGKAAMGLMDGMTNRAKPCPVCGNKERGKQPASPGAATTSNEEGD